MHRTIIIIATAVFSIVFSAPAEAARRHYQPTAQAGQYVPNNDGKWTYVQSTERPYKIPRAARGMGGHRAVTSPTLRQAAEAQNPSPKPHQAPTGSGIVRSGKTGATARVSPRFAPIAQAVVDDLERQGAVIKFMGGYRRGPCWSGGLHPCGLAIDLCQTGRGVVDRRCNLPSRAVEARVAAAHGALSGGVWCHQDRGHIQLGQTASACGSNLYSAVTSYHAKIRHRGKRVRYAARR